MRKGALKNSERSVILDDPNKIKTLNFKAQEYFCAFFLAKLMEDKIMLTDFFRACIEAYLIDDPAIERAISKYLKDNPRDDKQGYRPRTPRERKLKEKYRAIIAERERKLVPIAKERANEFYDVIEKEDD